MAGPVKESISIAAPVARVIDVVSDLGNTDRWANEAKGAEILENGADGRPSKIRVTLGAVGFSTTADYDVTYTDTSVSIGSDTYCGPYVYITSTNHSYDDPDQPVGRQWPRMEPVVIGPGCWIGTGAVILPGARLGRNVVVAAGAVVRGEVADHAVVAGAPARVVRSWDPEKGWQPPLRTPAPVPIPDGVTPEQLAAVALLLEDPAGD